MLGTCGPDEFDLRYRRMSSTWVELGLLREPLGGAKQR